MVRLTGTETPSNSGVSRVRIYRTLYTNLDRLEHKAEEVRARGIRWKRISFALAIVGILLSAGIVVAITSTQNSFAGISGETFTYDTTTLTITSQGHTVASATAGAAGITNSLIGAVEMAASSAGAINTALTAGNWIYQAKVDEASAAAITSATAYYKVELFLDGTSKGALYIKNTDGLVNNGVVEGATAKWDLGSSLPATGAYVVKLTQMAS